MSRFLRLIFVLIFTDRLRECGSGNRTGVRTIKAVIGWDGRVDPYQVPASGLNGRLNTSMSFKSFKSFKSFMRTL